MKTYIASWDTNYGLSVIVINANNKEDAKKIAEEKGAWDGYDIDELDTSSKGVVFFEQNQYYLQLICV